MSANMEDATRAAQEHSIATLPEDHLPKRAKNALLRGGIFTLEDAAEWTDRDLLSLPHIGHASVAAVRALMGR